MIDPCRAEGQAIQALGAEGEAVVVHVEPLGVGVGRVTQHDYCLQRRCEAGRVVLCVGPDGERERSDLKGAELVAERGFGRA